MNLREALEKAEKKVGGVRALARRLDWGAGNLAAVKSGTKPMPGMRAAQIAQLIGACEIEALLQANADAANGRGAEKEFAFWTELLRQHLATCPQHRGS